MLKWLRKVNMKQIKILVMLLAISFTAQSQAAESDIISDIPVTPINASRIKSPIKDEEAKGPVSDAVNKAIFDSVAKSLPAKSVKAYQEKVEAEVDTYGRTTDTVKVNTELEATPVNFQKVASNSTALVLPIPEIAGRDPVVDKIKKKYKPTQKIKIKPGFSELLPIATGLQNRIATPFRNVQIKTSDMDLPIEVDGGYVYLTPLTQAPIGLMIGERGMPETMVSLTLMPLDVPPVMIEVEVDMSKNLRLKHKKLLAAQDKAETKKTWQEQAQKRPVAVNDPRTNDKYVDRATSVLSQVAHGQVPPGFEFLDDIEEENLFPCDIRRMTIYHKVGQRLISGREIIDVVIIKNDINGFREIREEFCLADDVVAVAVFDKATLAPGEETELYILRDKLFIEKQQKVRARPRLTSTN